jgi:hypothetical protein
VKETLLSSQSFEDDSSLWVGELCKVREASLPPSLLVLLSSPG